MAYRFLLGGLVCGLLAVLSGCGSIPAGVEPVGDFEIDRYLGTWYEIARLDHSFERGLSHVTAEYTALPDGRIGVRNRGYNAAKEKWSEATAKARFAGDPTVGSLRVTFFWPFSAGYHIIALDRQNYEYAMVCSNSRNYLWILARKPVLEAEPLERLVQQAKAWGFATEALIFPSHE